MYIIKCDNNTIYDVRDDSLKLIDPKVNLEVNTIGCAGFKIYFEHPYYDTFLMRRSIFEISDEIGVIFRGVMTEHSKDINKGKSIDIEGVMGFFNGSIVRPFAFPGDFLDNSSYISSTNKIRFFLNWLISNHNSQVPSWQQFHIGTVTVTDPNNYITRSSKDYKTTWEVLKSALFDSSLGGYLCIRYEADGNYIDYLSEFTLTNTQEITYGQNLVDMLQRVNATSVFSAILPLGAQLKDETAAEPSESDEESTDAGSEEESEERLTIAGLSDFVQGDIHKVGDTLYSQSAVNAYGWIYAPMEEATWDDVTDEHNLLTKATTKLTSGAAAEDTREFKAVDLHFSDSEIRSFRIYRNQIVNCLDDSATMPLTKLDIDIANPQNTLLSVGDTRYSLIEQNRRAQYSNAEKIENITKDLAENRKQISEVRKETLTLETTVINDCQRILLEASRDFVSTGNFSEFEERISAALQVLSDDISIQINQLTSNINSVNGDLQQSVNDLSKYFDFRLDGLTIKTGSGNEMQLRLDNGMIKFSKNGTQFGWWDGTNFHTGNIIVDVEERAQFGNFAYVPRSDGSLCFLKVR